MLLLLLWEQFGKLQPVPLTRFRELPWVCRPCPSRGSGAQIHPRACLGAQVCVLVGTAGVTGTITFTAEGGSTKVTGEITGLAPGEHGFHIHQLGDTTNGCMSTGPHFNPAGKKHGAPTDEERHAGDLGNITAGADGVAKVDITDVQIPLDGPNTIVGRAVVCHELVCCASASASARPSCLTSPARLFAWKGTA
jgi:Cu-Zn family superoxide dismutase